MDYFREEIMKRIISILLIAAMAMSFTLAFHAEESEQKEEKKAENLYGDQMCIRDRKRAAGIISLPGKNIRANKLQKHTVICIRSLCLQKPESQFPCSRIPPE